MKEIEMDVLLIDSNFRWSCPVSFTNNWSLFLECGYHLDEDRMKLLNAYLDGRQVTKIDSNSFLNVMNYNKELELMNETEIEANEYLDAFVALGG